MLDRVLAALQPTTLEERLDATPLGRAYRGMRDGPLDPVAASRALLDQVIRQRIPLDRACFGSAINPFGADFVDCAVIAKLGQMCRTAPDGLDLCMAAFARANAELPQPLAGVGQMFPPLAVGLGAAIALGTRRHTR